MGSHLYTESWNNFNTRRGYIPKAEVKQFQQFCRTRRFNKDSKPIWLPSTATYFGPSSSHLLRWKQLTILRPNHYSWSHWTKSRAGSIRLPP
jgi:hypothetical protein